MPRLKTLASRLGAAPQRLVSLTAGSWRTSNQSSTARGYGYAWQKAREGHLRSHPFCVYCMRDAGIQAQTIEDVILECAARGVAAPYGNIVDHRIPHRGDQVLFWDRTNWQTLCQTHHSSVKQREEREHGD